MIVVWSVVPTLIRTRSTSRRSILSAASRGIGRSRHAGRLRSRAGFLPPGQPTSSAGGDPALTDTRLVTALAACRAKGRTHPEIVRLLKRAIAREIFKSLTRGLVAPELADLRPARQAKNITLRAAAKAMNTYPNKILRTERGTLPDYDLAQRYRTWLKAA
jgi:hypothetical protein